MQFKCSKGMENLNNYKKMTAIDAWGSNRILSIKDVKILNKTIFL